MRCWLRERSRGSFFLAQRAIRRSEGSSRQTDRDRDRGQTNFNQADRKTDKQMRREKQPGTIRLPFRSGHFESAVRRRFSQGSEPRISQRYTSPLDCAERSSDLYSARHCRSEATHTSTHARSHTQRHTHTHRPDSFRLRQVLTRQGRTKIVSITLPVCCWLLGFPSSYFLGRAHGLLGICEGLIVGYSLVPRLFRLLSRLSLRQLLGVTKKIMQTTNQHAHQKPKKQQQNNTNNTNKTKQNKNKCTFWMLVGLPLNCPWLQFVLSSFCFFLRALHILCELKIPGMATKINKKRQDTAAKTQVKSMKRLKTRTTKDQNAARPGIQNVQNSMKRQKKNKQQKQKHK